MPLAIQTEDIEQANLDRLHYILCPGNEYMLTPGLNRLEVLLQHDRKITCYRWMIQQVFSDLEGNKKNSVGYSLDKNFEKWAEDMDLREKSRVGNLRIAAAMLTVWPQLDDTLNVDDSCSVHVRFFKEMLSAHDKECKDYNAKKNDLSQLIEKKYGNVNKNGQTDINTEEKRSEQDIIIQNALNKQEMKNNIEAIVSEVDDMTNKSLKQRTQLLASIHNLMMFPSDFNRATSCIEVAKNMLKFSRTKIVGGLLLGLIGAVVLAASITCALGSFGLLCPISMVGVYLGFHLINGLLGMVGFGVGCLSVQFGVSFFKQGRSDRRLVNRIEQFVTNSYEEKEEKRSLGTQEKRIKENYCAYPSDFREGSYDGSDESEAGQEEGVSRSKNIQTSLREDFQSFDSTGDDEEVIPYEIAILCSIL